MSDKIPQETLFLHEAQMGLGAWQWGDRTVWNYGHGYSEADCEAAFRAAVEAGVNLVDTAEAYGSGRSEQMLGRFIKNVDKPILVATKIVPFPWRLTRGVLLNALRRSLERLNLKQVHLYQIHLHLPPRSIEFWAEELSEAVKAGLTRAVGVSNYNKNQMQRTYTVLTKYNIPLASNQVEYHLLNRNVEKNGLLDRCNELGVRLIAYSPLAKGLLTGKYTPGNPPPGFRSRGASSTLGRIQPLMQLLKEIGQAQGGKTPGQVALNWVMCKGALPIPGAKSAKQAAENFGALGWHLTPEQVKGLDEASDPFTK